MAARADSTSTPWYRQCWPWLVMTPPAAAVVAGAVMLTLAIVTDDGLVALDYAAQGSEVNARLTPEEAANCAVKDRRCMSAPVEIER